MNYTIGEASNKLHELLDAVKDGQQVTICGEDGQPAADLIPARAEKQGARKFGTLAGQGVVVDPNWHKGPETQEELEAWLEGRFE